MYFLKRKKWIRSEKLSLLSLFFFIKKNFFKWPFFKTDFYEKSRSDSEFILNQIWLYSLFDFLLNMRH